MSNSIENQSFGKAGAVFESGTTAITGDFCCLHCIAATVFSALTWAELSGDSPLGVTFPAGAILYGEISAFTLTSGAVLAYNAAK